MPRTVEVYECTTCGVEYRSFADAEECEDSHADLSVKRMFFEAKSPWPNRVVLEEAETGKTRPYFPGKVFR